MEVHKTNAPTTRAARRAVPAIAIGCVALVAALTIDWPWSLVPAAVALLELAVLDRRQLHALLNKWLWLGLALIVVLPVWLMGTPGDQAAQHAARGMPALTTGITMALRVLTTLAVLLLISGCLAPAAINRFLARFLGKELGLACAIGVNLLPAILEILRRTTLALRLRGGFQRHRLANLKRLATAVGVQTVRLTEDVAESLLLAQAPGRQTTGPEGGPDEPAS